MTPLQAVLAKLPEGGEAWIEEVLIRGQPGGGILGAHVAIGWKAPGIDGATVGGVVGPYPLSVALEDPAFVEISAALNSAAIDQIATLQARVAELEGTPE